jgi:hypothetical protein
MPAADGAATKPFSAIDPQNWAERHGGWILSICFHIIVFCLVATAASRSQPAPVASRLKVVLHAAPTPEPAKQIPQAEPPTPPTPPGQTAMATQSPSAESAAAAA